MAKFQFQSTEDLLIRLPPFIKSTDGTYIYTGDTCAVVVVKPGGTLYGSAVTMTRDANTGHWTGSIPLADHEHGVWLVKATSSGVAGALEQFREYAWGDYVDDITLTKTQATNAASSASSADGKCTTIAAVTSALPTFPSDPADESLLEAAIAAINTKLGTPAGASIAEDLANIYAVSTGKWVIDAVLNQLILYKWTGGWVEFKRFDLFDKDGNPASSKIYSRVPV